MLKRQPYDGHSRKLVLGFDIGTTFSGVSYCILEPGEIPSPCGVMRFPGTEHIGGDCKIPSVLYYDQLGAFQAAGAEADEEAAMENGWIKAEWFKLHLCRKTLSATQKTDKIRPLPKGKSIIQVFADFLRYLHKCACDYIEESRLMESDIWLKLEATAEIVLTHPNGWEGGQQELMRLAAIRAGVIPDTSEGRKRLFFVSEGEASLHFCVHNGWVTKLQENDGIIILDAGGGTIDVSAYKKASVQPLSYEEIAPPECSLNGSVFVTQRAEEYFEKHFNGSTFETEVPNITKKFDQLTKLKFANAKEAQFIRIGRPEDSFPALNVKSGRLKLDGSDIEKFFEPVIPVITQRIKSQCGSAEVKITSVVIVGGFSQSKWLFDKLKNVVGSQGLDLYRAQNHANKAVAHGAVSFRIDHLVTSRVALHSYGIETTILFDPMDLEHISRPDDVYTDFYGCKRINGRFSVVLLKGTKVSESQEFRVSYYKPARIEVLLNYLDVPIMCFRGRKEAPRWLDEGQTLCTVKADLSHLRKSVKYSEHIRGHVFRVDFDIILTFGSSEFKAYIAWEENGAEKRSPAEMVYNPDPFIVDF